MNSPSITLRIGARSSPLSLAQTEQALARLRALLPGVAFDLIPMDSPGDRDRQTDLRVSDPDFFTRFLDDALLAGDIDAAIHSAKDLPVPLRDGIDWCWLPWHQDRRDALILRPGETPADLPPAPIAGISSDRRTEYCRKRWPDARTRPIRGNIGHRLDQLDRGEYDLLIMAGAALDRLAMTDRITEWIPLAELETPAGQGVLAVTFRADDPRWLKLRGLLLKAVTLLSAGPGDPGLCPVAGIEALRRADVCLYDALAPNDLLRHLPPHAEAIFVGKRHHTYSVGRQDLDRLLLEFARQGKRVVRLKGGDAGIFGRLAQETAALDALHLPYRVIPGVSSLAAATTGTGLLLTRRGVCRGFAVVTPEQIQGDPPSVDSEERQRLPLALFMAVKRLPDVVAELLAEGRPPDEPAAIVFGASLPHETILTGTLATIAAQAAAHPTDLPGLVLVGANASRDFLYPTSTWALRGRRILLTCSDALLAKAMQTVYDLGGRPIPLPLIQLEPDREALPALRRMRDFDWIVVTSPGAVGCLLALLKEDGLDIRSLPRILTCGPGTAAAFANAGIVTDAGPASDFSAEGMLTAAKACVEPGQRVLRLRSDLAGESAAEALAQLGAKVTDVVLYRNRRGALDALPEADAAFFASGSAVDAFVAIAGKAALAALRTVAIGEPTARAMRRHGCEPTVIPPEATAEASILALAACVVLDNWNDNA